jgi:hypothetical protein
MVRAAGFVMQRKPEDCPPGFVNPDHHVVVGPPRIISKKQLMKRGHSIAVTPGIEIL